VAVVLTLRKAISPGAPATGGRNSVELGTEAERARRHARWTRADLIDQMTGLMRGYELSWLYGRAQLEATAQPAAQREIRAQLKRLRQETERAAQAAIRQAYQAQFGYGKRAGWNWRDLDEAEDKFVRRLRQEEYVFATRFLDDIERGRLVMPLEERAKLYGQAGDEAFWWGFLYADQSADQYVRWVTSEAEHCPDCLYLSGELPPKEMEKYANANPNSLPLGGRWGTGVYSAQELATLAIVPQSGELLCTTNCQCHLERVTRPPGKPGARLQRKPFRSLAPKPVQPKYEEKRSRVRTKRVKRDGTIQKGVLSVLEQDLLRVLHGGERRER